MISVIVPAYNVKKYVEKCVDSIINQTFSDYELILVDDGSTDGTSELCDELAKKSDKIRVFHKENGGLSDARNLGMDKAKGEYITFIDSDDYVAPTYLEELYVPIYKDDADVSITPTVWFFENAQPVADNKVGYEIASAEAAVQKMLLREKISHTAGGKLYKKELWENIYFPVGRLYEDYLTTFLVMENVKKVGITNAALYYYLQREDSIMHYKCNERTVTIVEATEQVTPRIITTWPNLEIESLDNQVAQCLKCKQHILNEASHKFGEIEENIKIIVNRNKKKLLFSKKTPKKDKVKILCFLLGDKIFRATYNIFDGEKR